MAKDLLVGCTGFVGGNLAAAHTFGMACHSTDIETCFGTQPELCVYAGVPAAMFLANADPEADLAVMRAVCPVGWRFRKTARRGQDPSLQTTGR